MLALSVRGGPTGALTVAGAAVLSEGSLNGANALGCVLIAFATLAWGIDNNLSQRLSLRDPIQIATAKVICASLPMLLIALVLGAPFPPWPVVLGLLAIGALGYGISIWLDLIALRHLGAAREAVIFSTAPFVGALFALIVLREATTFKLAAAAALMAGGVILLLRENHSHWHQHHSLFHAHRPRHDPSDSDLHHDHSHSPDQLIGIDPEQPFWHAHEHQHAAVAHTHPHVSDAHHRHRH